MFEVFDHTHVTLMLGAFLLMTVTALRDPKASPFSESRLVIILIIFIGFYLGFLAPLPTYEANCQECIVEHARQQKFDIGMGFVMIAAYVGSITPWFIWRVTKRRAKTTAHHSV